jgi:CTP synthase (UTP-ammonia lyase)
MGFFIGPDFRLLLSVIQLTSCLGSVSVLTNLMIKIGIFEFRTNFQRNLALRDMKPKVGIIGEFREALRSHVTLNESLDHVRDKYGFDFEYEWIDTEQVERLGKQLLNRLSGIWSAPGGSFKSLQGTLDAITYARENNIPHLGTCGGFQHTIVEFARNVLGIEDAGHEDYQPDASNLVISRLKCSLVGVSGIVHICNGTRAFGSYRVAATEEDFSCNFGVNPEFRAKLTHPDLVFSGTDETGEVRIAEITTHKFFLATLFVPQKRSTKEDPHPLIRDFIKAVTS